MNEYDLRVKNKLCKCRPRAWEASGKQILIWSVIYQRIGWHMRNNWIYLRLKMT